MHKIEVKTLVELLRGGFLPTSYVPPKDIRACGTGSYALRWILTEAARVYVQWCPNSKR